MNFVLIKSFEKEKYEVIISPSCTISMAKILSHGMMVIW